MGATLDIINADSGLSADKSRLNLFRGLAANFDKDITLNIDMTSIELDERYHTLNVMGWREFLNYAPIRKFIEGFNLEKANKEAMKAIGRPMDTKDGVRVKKALDADKKAGENANFIVMFMPRSEYDEGS